MDAAQPPPRVERGRLGCRLLAPWPCNANPLPAPAASSAVHYLLKYMAKPDGSEAAASLAAASLAAASLAAAAAQLVVAPGAALAAAAPRGPGGG